MMSHKKLLPLLQKIKDKIKKSDTVKSLCKEYDVDLDIIDLVPMCFSDNLNVSARTEHGIIYFNCKLLEKPEQIDHYMTHELTHVFQQTTGDGPTQGSNSDDYLDNPFEQEGFKNQTEYISETEGDQEAEAYISKVLDHHDVPEDEREERKEDLLQLASAGSKRRHPSEQLALNFRSVQPSGLNKTREQMLKEFEEAVAEGPKENHPGPIIKKLHPDEQAYRMEQLRKLLNILNLQENQPWSS